MALSDNPKSLDLQYKPRKLAATQSRWSDKQKIEAIQSYLLLGNLALTARMLSIPEITLRQWKATEWWNKQVEELRHQEKVVLTGKIKKIASAAMTAVEDRLENGDWIYDQKTGDMRRKHVSMKDAHKVAVDLLAKQDLLEKKVSPISQDLEDGERLIKLAERFATFVKPQLPVAERVDFVDVETNDTSIEEDMSSTFEEK
jgi:transposase-like protein